jgi:hypothetical protein
MGGSLGDHGGRMFNIGGPQSSPNGRRINQISCLALPMTSPHGKDWRLPQPRHRPARRHLTHAECQGSTGTGVNHQPEPCKASTEGEKSNLSRRHTHHRELARGLEPPTTCLQGPGTTSRDVHPRLRSGVTGPRKRLKSSYVAVKVAVNKAMIGVLSWATSCGLQRAADPTARAGPGCAIAQSDP